MKPGVKSSLYGVVIVSSFLILLYSGFTHTKFISEHLEGVTLTYLSEVAKQGVNLVESKIKDQFETIKGFALILDTKRNLDLNQMIEILTPEAKHNNFVRFGIITADGTAVTTDKKTENLGEREFFKKAISGETNVSDTLDDVFESGKINVYATPIHLADNSNAVLFASVKSSNYEKLLSVETFDQQGYSYVIKSNGEPVAFSEHANSIGEFGNFFEVLASEDIIGKEMLDTVKKTMEQGESGIFIATYQGSSRYVNYEPLSFNHWYVISVVPTQVVDSQAEIINKNSLLMVTGSILLIVSLFLVIFMIQNRTKKHLENLAYIDEVTGGNNWNKFKKESQKLLMDSTAEEYELILLNINRFRFINEEYEHFIGDHLLSLIMRIVSENITRKESCCRLTADNFLILSKRSLKKTTEKRMTEFLEILNEKKKSLKIEEKINCSFGVYKIKDPKEDFHQMREKANLAKIEAKKNGNELWYYYSESFSKKIALEKEIEKHMEEALENGEFQVYLQPKYNLHHNEYCGAEALARWIHPEKGMIFPNDFIPVFERNGFITKLDAYMAKEACKILERWKNEGRKELKISVNVSRKNLLQKDFISNIVFMVDQYLIEKGSLELELTESCMFEDIDLMIETGKILQTYGFEISMDDFGSGYSSINLLETLPLDTIKMDRGFFMQDLKSKRRFILVKSVIDLIKKLEMTVVAEGIETEEEVKVLREINCDIIQGYYYGKPMPLDEFEKHVFD